MHRFRFHLLLAWSMIGIGDCQDMFQINMEATDTINMDTPIRKDSFTKHDRVPVKGNDDDDAFRFAKLFQDNMVLQRAPARANIYGFAPQSDIGEMVTLKMTTPTKQYNYTTQIVAGKSSGQWNIYLDPMEANVTATIQVVSGGSVLNLVGLIFGDVWLCGGQSNMQFTTGMMFGGQAEIADAHNYPNIRLMTVAQRQSSYPLDDLASIEEAWTKPNKQSMNGGLWNYFSAVCWVFGKSIHKSLGVPVGLVSSNWGGTPVGSWSSPEVFKECGVSNRLSDETLSKTKPRNGGMPQGNSVLWNGMIHPLLNMTIYGAIWYQGERDSKFVPKRDIYNCTFPGMIADWRKRFNSGSGQTSSSFPFGFVQLGANAQHSTNMGFPEIRWHQTADIGFVPNPKMPNVFMAVAMDLPDFSSAYGSIHPRDKLDVGSRLALAGLAVAYNQNNVFQGPFPTSGSVVDGFAYQINYGSTWDLNVLGTEGFEFLCQPANGSAEAWVATDIVINNSTAVILKMDVCKLDEKISGVRYAWKESPCGFKTCAIYSTTNNLPAPPFVMIAKPGENEVRFAGPVTSGYFKF